MTAHNQFTWGKHFEVSKRNCFNLAFQRFGLHLMTYGPGPYGHGPLGPYGPGPFIT